MRSNFTAGVLGALGAGRGVGHGGGGAGSGVQGVGVELLGIGRRAGLRVAEGGVRAARSCGVACRSGSINASTIAAMGAERHVLQC